MGRVFVTRQLPGTALDRLADEHDVEVWPDRMPPPTAELRARAAEADGLLTLLTDQIDATLIGGAPRLKAIANFAVGYDNIDVAAAARRGIAVGNTPDVLTEATADLTFTLLLAAARKLPEALADAAGGGWLTWEPARYLGAEVHGACLGIVGLGRIGGAVARRAAGFEMEVIHTGRDDALPLDTLLERADFVSLHCPLTPQTHHLIGDDALSRMGRQAILINTARGPLVDTPALCRALKDGTIAGAALDVTDPEPLPPADPLFAAPNLIVAPHIGSATHAARERMAALAVDNLLAGLAGEPMPHPVRMSQRVAVVDIGSNSTRLLIVDTEGDRVTGELERHSQVTRLGAGVDRSGNLQDDAMERVFETIEGFHELIEHHEADRAVAVLTSAVRDAGNGSEFAEQIEQRFGLEAHILDGEQEAQLTFLGAMSERDPDDETPTLVVDIGGGSTELVIGSHREATFHVSTQAGVVRQSERHIEHDPPEDDELRELAEDVESILHEAVPEECRTAVRRGIGVAGTATSLGAIAQELEPYDPKKVHGYRLSGEERDRIRDQLSAMTVEERREVPGLHPDRAPTIIPGVIILEQVMGLFGLSELEVSEHDILRGAALGL